MHVKGKINSTVELYKFFGIERLLWQMEVLRVPTTSNHFQWYCVLYF